MNCELDAWMDARKRNDRMLAERLGLNVATIWRWRTGAIPPSPLLARALRDLECELRIEDMESIPI